MLHGRLLASPDVASRPRSALRAPSHYVRSDCVLLARQTRPCADSIGGSGGTVLLSTVGARVVLAIWMASKCTAVYHGRASTPSTRAPHDRTIDFLPPESWA